MHFKISAKTKKSPLTRASIDLHSIIIRKRSLIGNKNGVIQKSFGVSKMKRKKQQSSILPNY
jgi:hypothetical protein